MITSIQRTRTGSEASVRSSVNTNRSPDHAIRETRSALFPLEGGARTPLTVVCTAIGRLYADAGYDSADNRWLCLRDEIQPHIRKIGEPYGSALGMVRCIVEHGCAWLLANKRLDRRQGRLGRIILALLTAAAILIIATRINAF